MKKKKYKKKAECPDAVSEMINLVNVLPKGAELPNPFKILEEIKSDEVLDTKLSVLQKFKKAKQMWYEQLRNMPELRNFERLHKFLTTLRSDLDPSNEENTVIDVFNAYERFNDIRAVLDKLVESAKDHQEAYTEYGKSVYSWQGIPTSHVIMFAYGEEGEIDYKVPEHLEIFRGCGLIRFRRCAICDNIFFGKKNNAETCGEKNCASTLYNRKRLAREKAKREKRIKDRELRDKWNK